MDFMSHIVFYKKRSLLGIAAMLLAALCLVGTLSQTAQAANTYVITDGDAVMVHTTYASDPAKVLEEAGIALSEDDFYTTAASEGAPEIEIKVQRSQTITVYYGADTLRVSSYGESVSSLLIRLGIAVDATTVVSETLDTMSYDGLQLRVDRVGGYTENYTVEIPFESTTVEDPTLALGEEKILVAGKPGQKLCKANVTYVNGNESSRTVFEETVTAEPVTQVVAIGTGEQVGQVNDKPLIGDGVIVLPTGEVLTYTRTDQFLATAYTHTDAGCDMITANGAEVKWGVVAVDPKVIPYGTRMFIVSNDGAYIYGLSTAEDCGGAIQKKRLDLYMPTTEECFQFGVRNCTVYFLGDADWKPGK